MDLIISERDCTFCFGGNGSVTLISSTTIPVERQVVHNTHLVIVFWKFSSVFGIADVPVLVFMFCTELDEERGDREIEGKRQT